MSIKLKVYIGNFIFASYIIFVFIKLIILAINYSDNIKIQTICLGGMLLGFIVKFILIIAFIELMESKYLREDKTIQLKHLIIGYLLLLIAMPFSNFISMSETTLVLIIVTILKKNYKIVYKNKLT